MVGRNNLSLYHIPEMEEKNKTLNRGIFQLSEAIDRITLSEQDSKSGSHFNRTTTAQRVLVVENREHQRRVKAKCVIIIIALFWQTKERKISFRSKTWVEELYTWYTDAVQCTEKPSQNSSKTHNTIL